MKGIHQTRLAIAIATTFIIASVPVILAQAAGAATCAGVDVSPGASIQNTINSHGSNTTFCLKPGSYNISSTIKPKSGDAFVGTGTTRDDVTIKTTSAEIIFAASTNNLFKNLAIAGAVNRCPGSNCGATGMGINGGSNVTVDNVHLYDNGRSGIGGSGDGLLVTNSEVDHNGAKVSDGVSSGIKSVHSLTVTNSYVHDNMNSGIWCDISCGGYVVTGNTVTGQTGNGIFMEISQGQAVIANNVVQNNNKAGVNVKGGISVTSSMNAEVYGNTISGNKTFGLAARADTRAGSCGTPDANCGYSLKNIVFHDNNISGNALVGCSLSGVTCRTGSTTTTMPTSTTFSTTTSMATTTTLHTTTTQPTTTSLATTTTTPWSGGCSGVQVSPGANLASVVAGAPSGTTFCIKAGTYNLGGSSLQPKDNDKLIGASPSIGASGTISAPTKIVGSGAAVIYVGKASHVTLSNLDVSGATGTSSCRPQCGRGISQGDYLTVSYSRIHNNMNAGIGGAGTGAHITHVELDHNGSSTFTGCCAGGIKSSNPYTIDNSYVHDNIGNGIWQDVCGNNFVVTNNTVSGNTKSGVRYEHNKSCSGSAKITDNVIKNNNTSGDGGAAGVMINSAPGALVAYNTFGGNKGAGVAVGGTRGPTSGTSIHDSSLGGDALKGCTLSGVSCTNNH